MVLPPGISQFSGWLNRASSDTEVATKMTLKPMQRNSSRARSPEDNHKKDAHTLLTSVITSLERMANLAMGRTRTGSKGPKVPRSYIQGLHRRRSDVFFLQGPDHEPENFAPGL